MSDNITSRSYYFFITVSMNLRRITNISIPISPNADKLPDCVSILIVVLSPSGITSTTGSAGDTSSTGVTGSAGDTSSTGATGSGAGATGSAGAIGITYSIGALAYTLTLGLIINFLTGAFLIIGLIFILGLTIDYVSIGTDSTVLIYYMGTTSSAEVPPDATMA